jgi:hypothetical protein
MDARDGGRSQRWARSAARRSGGSGPRLRRRDVGGEMVEGPHSGDHGGHVRAGENEAERQLGERLSLRHERLQRLRVFDGLAERGRREIRVPEVAGRPAALGGQRPRQATFVEGDPGDDRRAQRPAGREQLVLGRLVEDVVDDLDGVDQSRPERPQDVGRLPPVHRDPHEPDEAVPPEPLERSLPSGVVGPGIPPDVELEEVDGPAVAADDGLRGGPDVVGREDVADPRAGPSRPLAVLPGGPSRRGGDRPQGSPGRGRRAGRRCGRRRRRAPSRRT